MPSSVWPGTTSTGVSSELSAVTPVGMSARSVDASLAAGSDTSGARGADTSEIRGADTSGVRANASSATDARATGVSASRAAESIKGSASAPTIVGTCIIGAVGAYSALGGAVTLAGRTNGGGSSASSSMVATAAEDGGTEGKSNPSRSAERSIDASACTTGAGSALGRMIAAWERRRRTGLSSQERARFDVSADRVGGRRSACALRVGGVCACGTLANPAMLAR